MLDSSAKMPITGKVMVDKKEFKEVIDQVINYLPDQLKKAEMEFSGQEYWNGLPFPSPEDLPDPGIEPRSPTLQADDLPSEPPGKLLDLFT